MESSAGKGTMVNGEDLMPFRECNLPREEIEAYATKVSRHFGLQPGTSLEPLVKRLGGKIEYRRLHDLSPDGGTIRVQGRNDFVIHLPQHTSAQRDRFTVAHELGHYFLHANQGERPGKATRSGVSERAEWEANWFAAALLMPAEEFQAALEGGSELWRIAADFNVSEAAAKVRADSLGQRRN